MILVPCATPLGLAYREWLLGVARVEADAGSPRLFGMKSDIAMYFADISRPWDSERRNCLMSAAIKLLCEKNYGYPPLPISDEEMAAWAAFRYPYKLRLATLGNQGTDAMRRWEQAVSVGLNMNKGDLKSAVALSMRSAFGDPEVGGPLWQYTSHTAGLKITTNLDFGGRRPSQLRYKQVIVQAMGQRAVPLLESGGISALLGWPQTEWCYLTDADIPAAADLLARLCTEFVEAVPGMWARSGLTGAEGV